MTNNLKAAWTLLLEGDMSGAKSLVETDFDLTSCQDFSFLNLMTYLYLDEGKNELAKAIMEKYVTVLLWQES